MLVPHLALASIESFFAFVAFYHVWFKYPLLLIFHGLVVFILKFVPFFFWEVGNIVELYLIYKVIQLMVYFLWLTKSGKLTFVILGCVWMWQDGGYCLHVSIGALFYVWLMRKCRKKIKWIWDFNSKLFLLCIWFNYGRIGTLQVAGFVVVSVLCCSSTVMVAILTNIPRNGSRV